MHIYDGASIYDKSHSRSYKTRNRKSLIVDAWRLSPLFADLVREGYSRNLFYGDEGEWTRDSRIKARAAYFWRLNRLCVPRNFELWLRLISELHEKSSTSNIGVG
jgi:hypothetical protein